MYLGKDGPEDIRVLTFLKIKEKKYELIKKISAHWETIAERLEVDPATVTQIRAIFPPNDFKERMRRVFQIWCENADGLPNKDDYPKTWNGLRQLLADSNIKNEADEYFKFLKTYYD